MPDKKRSAGPVRKRIASPKPGGLPAKSLQTDPAVTAFMRELDHRMKPELEALRRLILGVSPAIREGIKWNAPSFRTRDWFATINLRTKDGTERAWLILHRGAKVKDKSTSGMKIADPAGLLQWLSSDRCLVTFADAEDIQKRRVALRSIIREWVGQL